MTRALVLSATVALLSSMAAASAHHSIVSIYDSSRRVRVEGTVATFQFVSPHPFVELDVAGRNGASERWRLEMDNRFELAAVGMTATTLTPGDRVAVAGSAARDGSQALYVRELVRPSDGFRYEQVGSSPRVRLPGR